MLMPPPVKFAPQPHHDQQDDAKATRKQPRPEIEIQRVKEEDQGDDD
jgi:hypothetical protein